MNRCRMELSVEQNARDTQMTMRVTEGARRKRHSLVSRVSRARVFPFNSRSSLARSGSQSERCIYFNFLGRRAIYLVKANSLHLNSWITSIRLLIERQQGQYFKAKV